MRLLRNRDTGVIEGYNEEKALLPNLVELDEKEVLAELKEAKVDDKVIAKAKAYFAGMKKKAEAEAKAAS